MKPTHRDVSLYGLILLLMEGIGHATPELAPLPSYPRVAGIEVVHAVESGETIDRLSRRFGVRARLAMAMNRLDDGSRLKKGQRLKLSNRRIVPLLTDDGVAINVADRTLYWVRGGVLMAQFPVGVGRETWETPLGHYELLGRRRDPVWHVPPSIQREMLAKGLEVKTRVPAGPDNPLGKYWLQLSAGGIGIHGTNKPWTVGQYVTHGCIRMRADDIEWLYYNLPTGTSVDIVDEPVKFARLDDGTLLMEAHPLRKKHGPRFTVDFVAARLEASGLASLVDVTAVERTMRNAWGVAVDVTRRQPGLPSVAKEIAPAIRPAPAPRAEQKREEPRATAPAPAAAAPSAASTTIAVETYQRPDNYIWSGGRQLRVGRP